MCCCLKAGVWLIQNRAVEVFLPVNARSTDFDFTLIFCPPCAYRLYTHRTDNTTLSVAANRKRQSVSMARFAVVLSLLLAATGT